MSEIWDRLPTETNKAWYAFQVYRDMPLFGDKKERRTLVNAARIMEYSDDQQLAKWSSKNMWVERTQGYDAHLGHTALTIREAAIGQYQQAVIASLGAQLVVANEIIDRSLAAMKEELDGGKVPNALDVKRIMSSIHEKDDLARRAGKMPTNFTRESVPDEDEDTYYVIGEE